MARRGAVGGTARWAGRSYNQIKKSNPDASQGEIFDFLIENRYSDDRHKKILYRYFDFIKNRSGDNEIGLRGFVTGILILEAGFSENSPENQMMFSEVIKEELHKFNFSNEVIYGESMAEIMNSLSK